MRALGALTGASSTDTKSPSVTMETWTTLCNYAIPATTDKKQPKAMRHFARQSDLVKHGDQFSI